MVRLISRQRGGLAALKLTQLFGINDFPASKDSGKVLIIIIYCYLIIIIIIIIIINIIDANSKEMVAHIRTTLKLACKRSVDFWGNARAWRSFLRSDRRVPNF